MDQTRLKRLGRGVQDLLPQGKGFIMVLFDLGIEAEPVFVTNADPLDAIEAMRTIVQGKDMADKASTNGEG